MYSSGFDRDIAYMEGRHDCADFRLPEAMHHLSEFEDKLKQADRKK